MANLGRFLDPAFKGYYHITYHDKKKYQNFTLKPFTYKQSNRYIVFQIKADIDTPK